MSRLLEDPWFVATLDTAIAKYPGSFTRRQIKAFRRAIASTFETHPVAKAILARARPELVRRIASREPD